MVLAMAFSFLLRLHVMQPYPQMCVTTAGSSCRTCPTKLRECLQMDIILTCNAYMELTVKKSATYDQ